MSDFEKPRSSEDDYRDRAIDHALREVVGRETPPDLTQRILAAAEASKSMPTVSVAERDSTVSHSLSDGKPSKDSRRWWATLTMAASVAIAVGLLWPAVQATRESARVKSVDQIDAEPDRPGIEVGSVSGSDASEPERDVEASDEAANELALRLRRQSGRQIGQDGRRVLVTPERGNKPEEETLVEWEMDSNDESPAVTERSVGSPGQVAASAEVPDQSNFLGSGEPSSGDSSGMFVGPRQSEPSNLGRSGGYDGGGNDEQRYRYSYGAGGGGYSIGAPRGGEQVNEGYAGGGYGGRGAVAERGTRTKLNAVPGDGGETATSEARISLDMASEFGEAANRTNLALNATGARGGASPRPAERTQPAVSHFGATNGNVVGQPDSALQESLALFDGDRFRLDAGALGGAEATAGLQESKQSQLATQGGGVALAGTAIWVEATPAERRELVELEVEGRIAREQPLEEAEQLFARRESLLSKLQSRVEARAQSGLGPGEGGDKYERIVDNPFKSTAEENLSTFSVDVDTASYANVRQFLLQSGQLPPADAVRVEELINYFDYDYSPPTDDAPFTAHLEAAACPWNSEHRLVRIGIKGRELLGGSRPQSNLVFLIDVSGSMNEPAKLPLLVEGMKLLTRELTENDRVAIVVYASSEGLALPSTPGTQQQSILAALDRLRAGGSTAGGAGIQLAYETAQQHFIEGGVNRVILCTDGDFNVGVTSPAELERLAEEKAKQTGVALTVLGFGRGNLNDQMMEKISGKGNGNYYYIDSDAEAEKVLVAEMAGTLVTIAKDVKIQVDFNPAQAAGYRLIGYANRLLNKEDFNDDAKDAGEIGAGHTVTALYEIVPAGKQVAASDVDESKYVRAGDLTAEATDSEELLTVRVRYKQPDGDVSTKIEFSLTDNGQPFAEASNDFRFTSAVASFGMLLRQSEHAGSAALAGVEEIAGNSIGDNDQRGYRKEFLTLVKRARELRDD